MDKSIDQKFLLHKLINEEDKFVILLLDACRTDYFEQLNIINGDYRKVISRGRYTLEWFRGTFTDDFYDLTYVSANAWIRKKKYGHMFKGFIDAWDQYWNHRMGTVLPETLCYLASKLNSNRLLVHFMQPHTPYIGKPTIVIGTKAGEKVTPVSFFILEELEKGTMKPEYIRLAYGGNLIRTLKAINNAIPNFNGKIVITADHGELLGEGNYWWHPKVSQREYVKILLTVPYLKVKKHASDQ